MLNEKEIENLKDTDSKIIKILEYKEELFSYLKFEFNESIKTKEFLLKQSKSESEELIHTFNFTLKSLNFITAIIYNLSSNSRAGRPNTTNYSDPNYSKLKVNIKRSIDGLIEKKIIIKHSSTEIFNLASEFEITQEEIDLRKNMHVFSLTKKGLFIKNHLFFKIKNNAKDQVKDIRYFLPRSLKKDNLYKKEFSKEELEKLFSYNAENYFEKNKLYFQFKVNFFQIARQYNMAEIDSALNPRIIKRSKLEKDNIKLAYNTIMGEEFESDFERVKCYMSYFMPPEWSKLDELLTKSEKQNLSSECNVQLIARPQGLNFELEANLIDATQKLNFFLELEKLLDEKYTDIFWPITHYQRQ